MYKFTTNVEKVSSVSCINGAFPINPRGKLQWRKNLNENEQNVVQMVYANLHNVSSVFSEPFGSRDMFIRLDI